MGCPQQPSSLARATLSPDPKHPTQRACAPQGGGRGRGGPRWRRGTGRWGGWAWDGAALRVARGLGGCGLPPRALRPHGAMAPGAAAVTAAKAMSWELVTDVPAPAAGGGGCGGESVVATIPSEEVAAAAALAMSALERAGPRDGERDEPGEGSAPSPPCKRPRARGYYRSPALGRLMAIECDAEAVLVAERRERDRGRRTVFAAARPDGTAFEDVDEPNVEAPAASSALKRRDARDIARRLAVAARSLRHAQPPADPLSSAVGAVLLTSPRVARLCGAIVHVPGWISAADGATLLCAIECEINAHDGWRQDMLNIHGQRWPEPRLKAFFGCRSYVYHGVTMEARTMPPVLAAVTRAVNTTCGTRHNSVMATLYRNGSDAISLHADDEPCLGDKTESSVTSLSLGDSRVFAMSSHALGSGAPCVRVELAGGDLLHMGKGVQHNWRHRVDKTGCRVGRRISLTFRTIVHGDIGAGSSGESDGVAREDKDDIGGGGTSEGACRSDQNCPDVSADGGDNDAGDEDGGQMAEVSSAPVPLHLMVPLLSLISRCQSTARPAPHLQRDAREHIAADPHLEELVPPSVHTRLGLPLRLPSTAPFVPQTPEPGHFASPAASGASPPSASPSQSLLASPRAGAGAAAAFRVDAAGASALTTKPRCASVPLVLMGVRRPTYRAGRTRTNVYPRVPKCGECAHCLKPSLKKACLTNRELLRQSLLACGISLDAAPGEAVGAAEKIVNAYNATKFAIADPSQVVELRSFPQKSVQALCKAAEVPDKPAITGGGGSLVGGAGSGYAAGSTMAGCVDDRAGVGEIAHGPGLHAADGATEDVNEHGTSVRAPERRRQFYAPPDAYYGDPPPKTGVRAGDVVALADAWGLGLHRSMRRGMTARRWGHPSQPWPCESVKLCSGQKDAFNVRTEDASVGTAGGASGTAALSPAAAQGALRHYVGDGFYQRRPKGMDDSCLTFSDASLLASECYDVPVRMVHLPNGGTGGCIYGGLYWVRCHYCLFDGMAKELRFRLTFVLQRVTAGKDASVAAARCEAINARLRPVQELERRTGRLVPVGEGMREILASARSERSAPPPVAALTRDIAVKFAIESVVARTLLAVGELAGEQ